jgi:hypothetical protein
MSREEWIKILIRSVFEKAKKESKETSGYALSKYLYDEEIGISDRNLNRYYNFYIEGRKEERINPDNPTLDLLAKYLKYEKFGEYVAQGERLEKEISEIFEKKQTQLERKYSSLGSKYRKLRMGSVFTFIMLGLGLAFFMVKYFEENCMIWAEDHYEKVQCSGKAAQTELNMISMNRFRQITPCDTTTFFRNGNAAVWYDKSNNTLTYFTYPGKHPINGKALKDITQDIIDAHLNPLRNCDSIE